MKDIKDLREEKEVAFLKLKIALKELQKLLEVEEKIRGKRKPLNK